MIGPPMMPPGSGRPVIGMLVPGPVPYHHRVIQGVEQALAGVEGRLMLAFSDGDRRSQEAAVRDLIRAGANGLILASALAGAVDPEAEADLLPRIPVPVLLVEPAVPGSAEREVVGIDHAAGGRLAARYLRVLGHRRVGLVIHSDSPAAASVRAGFEAVLTDRRSGPVVRQDDPTTPWDTERADAAVAAFSAAGVTAVVCFGGKEASLLLRSARRRGLQVPRDLAVVSYDGEFADLAEVPLTDVSPPRYRLGRVAARVLFRRLGHGDAVARRQLLIRPRLTVRDSCGAHTLS
ncbi:LacI family DNA-binding transcriptional regulator [Streptomyces sp. NPDC053513]|uniref:LacI family DNA-binding transcriptional regulator n=1 Tax=unclassified Streptomyces TaxID=2593676 RepID=UPI0037CE4B0B